MLLILHTLLVRFIFLKTCNVIDYGCKPDGKTDCTSSIQNAINDCKVEVDRQQTTQNVVYFPSGKFLLFSVQVFSSQVILFDKDATLVVSDDIDNWPVIQDGYPPIIRGNKVSNLEIQGAGKIDGQGKKWWEAKHKGELEYDRPRIIEIDNCENLIIKDISIENSPGFNIVPTACNNVEISGVSLTAPEYDTAPNTDGIDTYRSTNVHIHDVYIATGDDCVCIKDSSFGVLVENSKFGHCLGASIGTGSGHTHNITFRNIEFDGTKSGVRIKFHDYSNGTLQNVVYENLKMEHVEHAITINQFNQSFGRSKKVAPNFVDISNVFIKNVTGKHISKAGILWCSEYAPCTGLHFKDIELKHWLSPIIKPKWSCSHAHGTQENVDPKIDCLKTN